MECDFTLYERDNIDRCCKNVSLLFCLEYCVFTHIFVTQNFTRLLFKWTASGAGCDISSRLINRMIIEKTRASFYKTTGKTAIGVYIYIKRSKAREESRTGTTGLEWQQEAQQKTGARGYLFKPLPWPPETWWGGQRGLTELGCSEKKRGAKSSTAY